MPRIEGMTDAQTEFLRAFRSSPFGPNVAFWPSAAVLRRWLQRPGFVRAMQSITATLRWHADFQLLSGAVAASHGLNTFAADRDFNLLPDQRDTLCQMIRLYHMRERHGAGAQESLKQTQTRDEALVEQLRQVDPKMTVGEFLKVVDNPVDEDVHERPLSKAA